MDRDRELCTKAEITHLTRGDTLGDGGGVETPRNLAEMGAAARRRVWAAPRAGRVGSRRQRIRSERRWSSEFFFSFRGGGVPLGGA